MLTQISNMVTKMIQPQQQLQTVKPVVSNNPFANPFVASKDSSQRQELYGKNKPVMGGYFAGYYNGKPNIVGTRLFIEV